MEKFYGEKGIDEYIRKVFFPGYSYCGVFIEIGAAGPEFLSMSRHFRESGWRVISIEPNPEFCEQHRKEGNEILQYACGNHDEDDVEFFVVDAEGAAYEGGKVSYESFSSLGFKSSYAEAMKDIKQHKIKVNLRKLDTILATHAPDVKHIDILSVDVEGWELEVIDGLNITKYRPRLMVIENLFNSDEYVTYMKAKGYLLYKRANPDDIYIHKDEIKGIIKFRWLCSSFYKAITFWANTVLRRKGAK